MNQAEFTAMVANKCGLEIINVKSSGKQLRLTARVHKPNEKKWQDAMQRLLVLASVEGCAWAIDVSRFYFVRAAGEGHQLVYSWRLIFSAETDIETHFESIIKWREPPKDYKQIESFPIAMPEHRKDRGENARSVREVPSGGR